MVAIWRSYLGFGLLLFVSVLAQYEWQPRDTFTYAAPFFDWDSLKVNLEFKGVVAVSMDMLQMDINQCDDDYFIPNAFKGTHKCDRKTSYCVPILGRLFTTGGYKCECLQGYEYPFEDLITYYDGVEVEFENLVNDEKTRFDLYQCRLAGAGALQATIFTVVVSSLLIYLFSIFSNMNRRN